MLMLLVLFVALVVNPFFARHTSTTGEIELAGRRYYFQPAMIDAYHRPPTGNYYVRLARREWKYNITFDQLMNYGIDPKNDPSTWLPFTIRGESLADTILHEVDGIYARCDKSNEPSRCGSVFKQDGLYWSVNFSSKDVRGLPIFVAEARKTIEEGRRVSNEDQRGSLR